VDTATKIRCKIYRIANILARLGAIASLVAVTLVVLHLLDIYLLTMFEAVVVVAILPILYMVGFGVASLVAQVISSSLHPVLAEAIGWGVSFITIPVVFYLKSYYAFGPFFSVVALLAFFHLMILFGKECVTEDYEGNITIEV
jgi:hypothetical protein